MFKLLATLKSLGIGKYVNGDVFVKDRTPEAFTLLDVFQKISIMAVNWGFFNIQSRNSEFNPKVVSDP